MKNKEHVNLLIDRSYKMSASFDDVVGNYVSGGDPKNDSDVKSLLSACIMGMVQSLSKQFATVERKKEDRDKLIEHAFLQVKKTADAYANVIDEALCKIK